MIASNQTILVVVRFKVSGSLSFLSHAETVRLFQRACVRTGVKIQYSQGFNPRPKIRLPLPRSVGLETDDDLLCIAVQASASSFNAERFNAMLSAQLPDGFDLLEVTLAKPKASFQPCSATYVLTIHQADDRTVQYTNKELKRSIEHLMQSKSLTLERQRGPGDSRIKKVDVRPFLKSIQFDGKDIVVQCKISSAGSIRVDEILNLLKLDQENLAAPVRRVSVQWQDA